MKAVQICANTEGLFVLMPDGRIWLRRTGGGESWFAVEQPWLTDRELPAPSPEAGAYLEKLRGES